MSKLFPFLFLLTSAKLVAQLACSNYFEGTTTCMNLSIGTDSNNVWQIGQPQKQTFNHPSSTPNVLLTDLVNPYPSNNTSSIVFKFNNQEGTSNITAVQWKQKLDLEQAKDAAIIEFSFDRGVTWENAHNQPSVYQFYGFVPGNKDTVNGEYCLTGRDTVWRDIWLCFKLAGYISKDSTWVRFTLKSDSVNSMQDGWMIDNLIFHRTEFHVLVSEHQIEGQFRVYPSVTSGILNVETLKTQDVHPIRNMELIATDGKVLENYGPNYAKVVLDLSNYVSGTYILRIHGKNNISTQKVVLQKE